VATTRAGLLAAIPGSLQPATTREAIELADRALAKDPGYVDAFELRGRLRFELAEALGENSGDEARELYRLAEADLREAVERSPQQAGAWWALSRLLHRKGSFAAAKQAARRALAADAFLEVPVQSLFQLFSTALEQEEHEEAGEWCAALRKLHPENVRWVQCELIQLATSPLVGPDPARGWRLVDSMVDRSTEEAVPQFLGWATLFVAKTLARAGLADSARAVLERAIPEPPPAWALYDAAHAYLMLGDEERALEFLALRVAAAPGRSGSLAKDWWFRPLHGDPRLERLIGMGTEERR
jgi:tetratricopeptide (TPR) repeat protein